MDTKNDEDQRSGEGHFEIRLFGIPTISGPHGCTPLPNKNKASLALINIAVRTERALTRDELAAAIWPNDCGELESAMDSLNKVLRQARKSFFSDRTEPFDRDTRGYIGFNTDIVNVDVGQFNQCVDRARNAPLAERQRLLGKAISVYRGPLLDGWSDTDFSGRRRELHREYLLSIYGLAICCMHSGCMQQALALLVELSRIAPHDFLLRLILANTLARLERRADAIVAIEHAIELDSDERCNQPHFEQFLKSLKHDATIAVPPLPELRGYWFGVEQASLLDPSSLNYQAIYKATLETFNSYQPNSLPQTHDNQSPHEYSIPISIGDLIGREDLLQEVQATVTTARLVTVVGFAGMGKTRLALEVAKNLWPTFTDGSHFIQLAEVSADSDVGLEILRRIVGSFNTEVLRDNIGLGDAVRLLQNKEALIVLDNCEHLIQSCSDIVKIILGGCPLVTILATSREPLGIPGETVREVGPLLSPSNKSLDAYNGQSMDLVIQDFPALALFVRRAKEACRDFSLLNPDVRSIAKLCRHLDGNPLALELAASRTDALSVDQILDDIGDRFTLLGGGSSLARRAKRTLRETIDWSYRRLSGQEVTLLDRLSVFRGTWTLIAATKVCSDDAVRLSDDAVPTEFVLGTLAIFDSAPQAPSVGRGALPLSEIRNLLGSLVSKSLVVRVAITDGGRYMLLETMREYLLEKLKQAGEYPGVCTRHACYYTDLGHRIDQDYLRANPLPYEIHGGSVPIWSLGLDKANISRAFEYHRELMQDAWRRKMRSWSKT